MTIEMTKSQLTDMIDGVLRERGAEALAEQINDAIERKHAEWVKMTSSEQHRATVKANLFGQRETRGKTAGDQGMAIARLALGMAKASAAHGRATLSSALPTLKALGGEYEAIAKSLSSGNFEAGGALIPEDYSADFIEYLHAQNIVRALGARVIEMPNGRIVVGRQDSTATAYWIGEGSAITASQETYGQIVLAAKKLGILVPISNDLLRANTIPRGVAELVRDDILRVAVNAEEKAILEGSGSNGEPQGIYSRMGSGQRVRANGTFNVANATSDLLEVIYRVAGADVPMASPGFALNPRTKYALMSLRTSDGYPVFMQELSQGTLMGYRALTTNNILANRDDTTSGDNDETRLYFADWQEVLIGETLNVDIAESAQASYVASDATTRHGFQRDESLIRLIHEMDCNLRHTVGAACIDGIDWGKALDS